MAQITADTLKLARDGQLTYGKPDLFLLHRRACAARGHGGSVEYSDGSHRCLSCFTDFIPNGRSPVGDRVAEGGE